MTVEYDPYSDEAMTDPRALYARLRAEDPVHYVGEYDAWALASFDAVWQVCRDTTNFTCTQSMVPNSVLLGEPVTATFTALDPPEHRLRRRILSPAYTRDAAADDEQYARRVARSLLETVVASGRGELDVYRDFARKITARTAGRKAGVPEADAERVRLRLDDMFARDPGQKGTSEANVEAALDVLGFLLELIATARANPDAATGDLAALLAGSIDDRPLTDEELVGDLMTILVTGSDTTEFSVAATLLYLQEHPDQLAAVRADRSLVPFAFLEAVRCDHPTDMLCRRVLHDVEVGGRELRAGQGVMLLWGSASLDDHEYPRASEYDIFRRPERSLLFGHGQHKCIGEHLSTRVGTAILDEFLDAVGAYEIDRGRCTRRYGEFLKGFNGMPLRFDAASSR